MFQQCVAGIVVDLAVDTAVREVAVLNAKHSLVATEVAAWCISEGCRQRTEGAAERIQCWWRRKAATRRRRRVGVEALDEKGYAVGIIVQSWGRCCCVRAVHGAYQRRLAANDLPALCGERSFASRIIASCAAGYSCRKNLCVAKAAPSSTAGGIPTAQTAIKHTSCNFVSGAQTTLSSRRRHALCVLELENLHQCHRAVLLDEWRLAWQYLAEGWSIIRHAHMLMIDDRVALCEAEAVQRDSIEREAGIPMPHQPRSQQRLVLGTSATSSATARLRSRLADRVRHDDGVLRRAKIRQGVTELFRHLRKRQQGAPPPIQSKLVSGRAQPRDGRLSPRAIPSASPSTLSPCRVALSQNEELLLQRVSMVHSNRVAETSPRSYGQRDPHDAQDLLIVSPRSRVSSWRDQAVECLHAGKVAAAQRLLLACDAELRQFVLNSGPDPTGHERARSVSLRVSLDNVWMRYHQHMGQPEQALQRTQRAASLERDPSLLVELLGRAGDTGPARFSAVNVAELTIANVVSLSALHCRCGDHRGAIGMADEGIQRLGHLDDASWRHEASPHAMYAVALLHNKALAVLLETLQAAPTSSANVTEPRTHYSQQLLRAAVDLATHCFGMTDPRVIAVKLSSVHFARLAGVL